VSSRPARGPGGPSARAQDAARQAAVQAAAQRRERRVLVAFVVGLVVVVVGGGIGFQAWRTMRAPSALTAVAGPAVAEGPQTLTDGQPIRLGAADAPVAVQLYEDFHCPHCADFEEEFDATLTAAQAAGTVRVELFPMAFIDAGSTAASNALACAAEAGFGERYYRGLFANPTLRWDDGQLVDLAGVVGAPASDTFAGCVRGDAKAGWVAAVNAAADANGVTGTPTMFLDGQPVQLQGLTPESLQAQIDAKR
jgi:protein-disulfide isomerase